jgi:enoyl-CoA hydratase/carnithine racemase
MAQAELLYDVNDGIGLITFNRPQARNALTFEMYEQLADICSSIEIAGPVRILIITGAGGKAFAAGTDISRFRDFSTPEDALNYERRMDRVLGTLEDVPVPVIAAIRGACTGGGAAIAACCDLRIASPDLKYGFPIARTLGNCLSNNNLARLAGLLGAARTREIILTARLIEAHEAGAIGLVTEVAEDPLARARELAERMAGHAPLTMKATKQALNRLRKHAASQVPDEDLIVECYTSRDFRHGLEAFLAKQTPTWQGR